MNELKGLFQRLNTLWMEREQRIVWKNKVQKYRDDINNITKWFRREDNTVHASQDVLLSHIHECDQELAQTKILTSTVKRHLVTISEVRDCLKIILAGIYYYRFPVNIHDYVSSILLPCF